jgi:hypothetical protein
MWALATPYDPKIVEEIKRLPSRQRAWLPAASTWMIDERCQIGVRGMLSRFYWLETLCEICWTGMLCPRLVELARLVEAVSLTAVDWTPATPKTPPVKMPAYPRDRQSAAEQLGVPANADAATVRAAARRAAFEWHPDRGGSAAAVVAIMAARDMLVRR